MAGSDYEAQRLEIIARNRARLQQLGLTDAADKLAVTTAKPKKAAKPKAARKPKPPAAPTRHSRRQGGQAPAELTEEERQLAAMYVDGVCPKCGKALEKGIKQHLASCSGRPSRPQRNPDAGLKDVIKVDEEEEDDEQQVTKLLEGDASKLQGKLKELELSGLIDFSPDKAEFAVLGSTGSKYVVTLADARHTCRCMDFRIRRRPCKHIWLVLQQLGVADSPTAWHQAVDRQLDAAARAGGSGGGGADGAGAAAQAVKRDGDDGAAAEAEPQAEAEADTRSPVKKEKEAPKRKGGRARSAKTGKRQKPDPTAKGSVKSEPAGSRGASVSDSPGKRRMPKSLQ